MTENNFYGYVDTPPANNNEGSLVFGLQEGVLKKFHYNPEGGQNSSEMDCFDISVEVNGKTLNRRFFPITKVFDKKGNEIAMDSSEYKAAFDIEVKAQSATLCGIVSSFIGEENLKKALSHPITDWVTYMKVFTALMSKYIDSKVTVFLRYQWESNSDDNKRYLELPKNNKHGNFLFSNVGEITTIENKEKTTWLVNNVPVTERTAWFMKSNFAVVDNNTKTTNSTSTSFIPTGKNSWD